MEVKIKNKAGIKLLTADTLCEEDIVVTLDSSLIPSGTLDIYENGIHDVEQYAQVNVEIQSGIDTSDATATSEDILLGKTAYANDEKIEGTIEEYDGSNSDMTAPLGSSLKELLDYTKSTSRMFYSNKTITDLTAYISYSDTENVIDTTYMYQGCTELLKSSTNLQSATKISGMYSGCSKLRLIEIYNYNISSASNANQFAASCYSLKALVFRSFGEKYIAGTSMFLNCYHILGTQDSTYNPQGLRDGYIYMPRDMIEKVSKTNPWDSFISIGVQIRALEDYTLDGTTTGEFNLATMGLEGEV